jgi:hypothetical protein
LETLLQKQNIKTHIKRGGECSSSGRVHVGGPKFNPQYLEKNLKYFLIQVPLSCPGWPRTHNCPALSWKYRHVPPFLACESYLLTKGSICSWFLNISANHHLHISKKAICSPQNSCYFQPVRKVARI